MSKPIECWNTWCTTSRADAEMRWKSAQGCSRPAKSGKEWLGATLKRLALLNRAGILPPRESGRISEIPLEKLALPDQKRLRERGLTRGLFAFAVASADGERQTLAERFISLNPSRHLFGGRLSLQVFIDEHERLPVGMNIQLRGIDPARGGRPTYLRYDLDPVAMGRAAGPVTHFNSHWHAGDDPIAGDAEDHDPRLPSLILDPLAVLDILVETFFPAGPADIEP